MSNPPNILTMQNAMSRVGRALAAAVAGGSGATAVECRARNASPATTPSFLASDDFEVIDRASSSSSSSSASSPAPPAPSLADQVPADELSRSIDLVMKSLPAMDQSASPLVLSGSASPASSDGGTAAHMRDAEESLAVAEELQQQQQQQQQLQTLLHSQEQYLAFRATLVHLLSDRRVRAELERALLRSPEFAQVLQQLDQQQEAAREGGGGGGGEEDLSALADLYPLAARAALASAAPREGGAGGGRGGGGGPPPFSGENDAGGGGAGGNHPLAAAVAEALSAFSSSAKELLAGAGASALGAALEAGVCVLGWTRLLAQVARGEETGPWTTRAEGGGGGGGGGFCARARSFRAGGARSRPRRSLGSVRPSNLDEWVKLVSVVAMVVVAVIFLGRRGRFAARGGGGA